jgi:hypothetical protein
VVARGGSSGDSPGPMPWGLVEKVLLTELYYAEVAPVLVLKSLYPADRGKAGFREHTLSATR